MRLAFARGGKVFFTSVWVWVALGFILSWDEDLKEDVSDWTEGDWIGLGITLLVLSSLFALTAFFSTWKDVEEAREKRRAQNTDISQGE